jgi:3-keto-5-aminohexanoate cleavage enzyme
VSARSVIVTVAPTGGSLTRQRHPNVPTQPAAIADDVARCAEEGATIAALHARRDDDRPTCDERIYSQMNTLIRERCEVVINNSTGGGVAGELIKPAGDGTFEVIWEQRLRGVNGGADMCTLDAITFFAIDGDREVLMKTPPSRGRELAQRMSAKGIKPEWEAFSPTHLAQDIAWLINQGFDQPPHLVNIVLGLDQVFQGALPYSPSLLRTMVELLPANSIFSVSLVGAFDPAALADVLLLGGHVRVGLEDTPFDSQGRPWRNDQLVSRVVTLIEQLGMSVASPADTRRLLGLPHPSATGAAV